MSMISSQQNRQRVIIRDLSILCKTATLTPNKNIYNAFLTILLWRCSVLARAFLTCAFVSLAVASSAQPSPVARTKFVTPLKPLLEALNRAHVSGSMIVSGHCSNAGGDFPHLSVPSETTAQSPLDIARETLADDPAIRVSKDLDGNIRMVESGVPTGLLHIKIKHISFEGGAFSASDAARRFILRAPEVLAFMQAHDIDTLTGGMIIGSNAPLSMELPHLSGSMDNVTVSEAMDMVLKTFPGIWAYESCPHANGKGQFIHFLFFDLKHPWLFEVPQK